MKNVDKSAETTSRGSSTGGFMMPRHWGSGSPPPKIKDVRAILMRLWGELSVKHKTMIALVFVMTLLSSILGLT